MSLNDQVPHLSGAGMGVHSKNVSAVLKAPFPWFGGKSRAASLVWEGLGDVTTYVEPFAGSLAVLLGRPQDHRGHIETVNDLDCFVANFWRALARDPEAVARHADWPVNEADLYARHKWLVSRAEFRELMRGDPEHYDARVAGWWVWGLSCWIGGGWCAVDELPNGEVPSEQEKRPECASGRGGRGVHRLDLRVVDKRPHLSGNGGGVGVHSASIHDKLPDVGALAAGGAHVRSARLVEWFATLSERLRRVRVCCGDWTRVLTTACTTSGHGVCGVMLDPPYSHAERDDSCYATEDDCSTEVRRWAIENGSNPLLRIVLAGYEGEHDMPSSWRCVMWTAVGGYARGKREGLGVANRYRERLWFSPACLEPKQGRLFA